jgi:two-component system sensor histidine kinase KdpD
MSSAPDPHRPSPDALLASIQEAQTRSVRGRLKVFLGMCPGVGKTYAMLEAAGREKVAGRDAVIGYVESHGRAETDALTKALGTVPRRVFDYRGISLSEMDLDAVLARNPQLAIVDELAHTNAPGSRHPKRWQDIQELLDAGIDVFTTLNVQHVESRADTVRQITGTEIRETVPDGLLDLAVLELIDLPPSELMQRLREGKVYLGERAAAAEKSFFRECNLTALRELSLRLVADHVSADTRGFREMQAGVVPWKTAHCLLVAVGPSPHSQKLVRWTRRMADALSCRWIAVHVECSMPSIPEAQAQLEKNLAVARELGAEVVMTTDDDLVRGLLRVGRQQNATQIVVGKPGGSGWLERFRGERLVRRLARESGEIDLQIVQAEKTARHRGERKRFLPRIGASLNQYLFVLGSIAATAVLGAAVMLASGPRVPGLIFLLAVVLLALRVGRGPVLFGGALSALVWNFFFLPPQFTFVIHSFEDFLLFALYFVVAIVLGQLVAKIRVQEQAERRREERAIALYEFTRELSEAGSRDEVVWQLVGHISRLFEADVGVALVTGEKLLLHPDSTWIPPEKEMGVADWGLRQKKAAGRFTDNLPGSEALHIPLATERKGLGVLMVRMPVKQLPLSQRDLLEIFARQTSLILDRIELRSAAEQARLLSEADRFSRTLLNSISHELRTPLAASTSAVAALAEIDGSAPPERKNLLHEIVEANGRLNRVVGNLLGVTRLESGQVRPNLDWHDARDLVQTTLRYLDRELAASPLKTELPPAPALVRIDFSLMQHALSNLLLNAVAHTPPGTAIQVRARIQNGTFVIEVSDNGPGIAENLLPRIFEKFYRAPGAAAGGSGLGLTIVKGFVEAQGGTVAVSNRPGGGALFAMSIAQPEKPPTVAS